MRKKLLLQFVLPAILAIVVLFFGPAVIAQVPSGVTEQVTVTASAAGDNFNLGSAAEGTGVIKEDIPELVARFILAILRIVGVIFLLLIIYGGVRWMTSGGNEKQVATAKKVLTTASIGLVIIMVGYGITYWIVSALQFSSTTQ